METKSRNPWDLDGRFVAVTAALVGGGWLMALFYKTQATVLVLGLALVFFLGNFFLSVRSLVQKKERRRSGLRAMLCIVFLALVWPLFPFSNRDLIDLNLRRKEALAQIRPALLRYRADHNTYPAGLSQLVPRYIKTIDPVLLNRNEQDAHRMIHFQSNSDQAQFTFFTIRGRNSVARYDVEPGTFWFKPPWSIREMFRKHPK